VNVSLIYRQADYSRKKRHVKHFTDAAWDVIQGLYPRCHAERSEGSGLRMRINLTLNQRFFIRLRRIQNDK
jgi:hypothetical protein